MNALEVIEREHEYVVGVYGRPPFVLEKGQGSTLYDSEGKAYLDCVAGIAVNALGYNDAGVMETLRGALESGLLHVSNLYHSEAQTLLAQTLVEGCFADKAHFCNSGAEANEGAFKFARRYARTQYPDNPEKHHILAFSNAFHGRTMGALAATPRPKYQDPFLPLMPGVRFAEFNNLASARAQMDENVCAILVEPLQGEGGIYPASPAFLAELRLLADEFDALLIFDEVQCGVGRTGTLWAHQGIGDGAVEPDIMTAAKPLANGLPIGAILVRQKVADVMHKGEHGSTFAGGPLVTAVANHVVSRIAQPAFLADVQAKGDLLKEKLEEINNPHIVQVRGKGLMLGVELDRDVTPVVNAGYAQGLLVVSAGPNVVRLVPPLIITAEEIDAVVHKLTAALQVLG